MPDMGNSCGPAGRERERERESLYSRETDPLWEIPSRVACRALDFFMLMHARPPDFIYIMNK